MDSSDGVCVVSFHQTREEMKSLQEAFQKQLNEAAEKAEKQQATVSGFFWSFLHYFCLLLLSFLSSSLVNFSLLQITTLNENPFII